MNDRTACGCYLVMVGIVLAAFFFGIRRGRPQQNTEQVAPVASAASDQRK